MLRNLDINSGLCNGTTLQILSINHKVLKVKITNGSHIGNIGLIPRNDLTSSETSLPFRMNRRLLLDYCSAMHPFRPTIPQIRIIGFIGRNGCIALPYALQ